MPAETKKEIGLEIAHVLFIDIVGYSKLLTMSPNHALQRTAAGHLSGVDSLGHCADSNN